jgi:SAM-dependent methyltransferase
MADDEATGWFEPLYARAAAGEGDVPWDGGEANPLLHDLVPDGPGRAIVVGCGLGDDADLVAARGWDTLAFDVSPTAVRLARERFPAAAVDWRVADLLELPGAWLAGFDLVLEHYTVQALPVRLRETATAAVRSLVAPGGTLLVLAMQGRDPSPDRPGPPWVMTRDEVLALGAGWEQRRFEDAADDTEWVASFRRPA